jgi:1,4-alpha-glucan branching enzyme
LSAAARPTDPALQALCAGRHDDPFAVLGPHDMSGLRYVTAFDPRAAALSARAGGDTFGLAAVPGHPGLFRGPVPGDGPYRLTGETPDGIPFDHDDPYRFGPVLGEIDEYLIGEGTHRRLWTALGAHVMRHEGVDGTHFAVWAPNAQRVSVVGDFNGWDGRRHAMRRRGSTGVWEIFLPGIGDGAAYKYELLGPDGLPRPLKADPVGFGAEHPPRTASVVRDIAGYGWHDAAWMAGRGAKNGRNAPIAIYEVHLGSWRRKDGGRHISYREAAEELVDYAVDMGFTHIELMPIWPNIPSTAPGAISRSACMPRPSATDRRMSSAIWSMPRIARGWA